MKRRVTRAADPHVRVWCAVLRFASARILRMTDVSSSHKIPVGSHVRSTRDLAPRFDRGEEVRGDDGAAVLVNVEGLTDVRVSTDELVNDAAAILKHGDAIHNIVMFEQSSKVALLPGMSGT